MKRLSKNISSILGSDLLRRLLGFVAVTYLARHVGTEGFGIVSLGFTVLSYAMLLSNAGLGTLGTRETARAVRRDNVRIVTGSRLRNSIVIVVVVSCLIVVAPLSGGTKMLLGVFLSSVFAQALSLDWYYQGIEQMWMIGLSRTLSAVVYLVVLLLAVHGPTDLLLVAIAAVGGDVASTTILLWRYHRSSGGIHVAVTATEWKESLRSSLPLGAGSMIAQAVVNLPIMVLAFLLSTFDVGIYSAASKLVLVLLMFDRALGTVLLPASTRLEQVSRTSLVATLTIALKWVLVISLPVCVGGSLLASPIIALVFGSAYNDSAIVFAVLIWFVLFTMMQTVVVSGLIAVGKDKTYATCMALSALLSSVVIIGGTMAFGILGAAIAAVGSEMLTVILLWLQLRPITGSLWQRSFIMIMIAVVVMGAVVWVLGNGALAVSIPAGILSYSIGLLMTRALTLPEVFGFARRFW